MSVLCYELGTYLCLFRWQSLKNRATSLCFSAPRSSHTFSPTTYPCLGLLPPWLAQNSPSPHKNVEIKLTHSLAFLCGSNSFYFLCFHLYIGAKNLPLASLGHCNSKNEMEILNIKAAGNKGPWEAKPSVQRLNHWYGKRNSFTGLKDLKLYQCLLISIPSLW